jgi:hypothetical protein
VLQAEAEQRKQGSLQEVALLSIELEEFRNGNFEEKYKLASKQVCA